MNIVLLNPEIPYNTGNIGRTCVLTNTTLHLIKPLGFSIDEKSVRRAGLDYWKDVKIVMWENLDEFLEANKDKNIYFATTKTNQKQIKNQNKPILRKAALQRVFARTGSAHQLQHRGHSATAR